MLTGMLSAQADVAISADTYGIINIPIIEGMNAIGISLLPMPEATTAVEETVLTDGLTASTETGSADKLYVFNGTDYLTYFLDSSGETPSWNGDSNPAVTAILGNAMWIKSQAADTIYEVGRIASEATRNIALKSGENNFIANPFPSDLNLATVTWSGVAAPGKKRKSDADLLLVWDAINSAYTTYFYVEVSGIATGWYSGQPSTLATEIIVPAGEGFWFYRKSALATDLSIANPFSN